MITLLNPTNETMTPSYGGVVYVLKPKSTEEVEDAAAHHILNSYDQRGLCRLKFGDDLAEVSAQGLQRNREFKKRMVMQHNQLNLARSQQGMSYIAPTATVKQYAVDLELVLDEPFSVKHNTDVDDRRAATRREEKMQEQIDQLTAQIQTLIGKMGGPVKKGKPGDDPD